MVAKNRSKRKIVLLPVCIFVALIVICLVFKENTLFDAPKPINEVAKEKGINGIIYQEMSEESGNAYINIKSMDNTGAYIKNISRFNLNDVIKYKLSKYPGALLTPFNALNQIGYLKFQYSPDYTKMAFEYSDASDKRARGGSNGIAYIDDNGKVTDVSKMLGTITYTGNTIYQDGGIQFGRDNYIYFNTISANMPITKYKQTFKRVPLDNISKDTVEILETKDTTIEDLQSNDGTTDYFQLSLDGSYSLTSSNLYFESPTDQLTKKSNLYIDANNKNECKFIIKEGSYNDKNIKELSVPDVDKGTCYGALGSPDGKEIAYLYYLREDYQEINQKSYPVKKAKLYVLNVDSGDVRYITDGSDLTLRVSKSNSNNATYLLEWI